MFHLSFVVPIISIFLCACDSGNVTSPVTAGSASLIGTPVPNSVSTNPFSPSPSSPGKAFFRPLSNKGLFDWAEFLVENVKPADTDYQHSNGVVTWAGEHGAEKFESRTDCSGFLIALLTQTYELGKEDFAKWLGKTRPLAVSFFNNIASQRGFSSVDSISQVQIGDIIAIKYVNSAPGDNTGHIMLVASLPQNRVSTKPLVAGFEQWELIIIDSSSTGHGKTDTRHKQGDNFNEGAGKGKLRLYTQTDGKIVGYSWSVEASSEYYDKAIRPMLIGRIDPNFLL